MPIPTSLPTQVFSYVVDKVLGGKLWPREWTGGGKIGLGNLSEISNKI